MAETSALHLRYADDDRARLREALEHRTSERDEALATVAALREEVVSLRQSLSHAAARWFSSAREKWTAGG